MRRAEEFFQALTAGDVMGRAVVVPHGMSVVTAARLLVGQRLRVALVTDAPGRCVGVLAAADFLRWAAGGGRADKEGDALTACVWSDWQVVDVEPTRRDEVRRHMTCDPLLVTPDTPLAEIAEAVLDPRGCPVVVVDERRRPLGVVSSRDVLAALASVARRPEAAVGRWPESLLEEPIIAEGRRTRSPAWRSMRTGRPPAVAVAGEVER